MRSLGWWIIENDQWRGPLDIGELTQRANQGLISPHSLIWGGALIDWTPLYEIPELKTVLQACSDKQIPDHEESKSLKDALTMPVATPDQGSWLRFFARSIDFAIFGGLFLLFYLPNWGADNSARSLIIPLTLTAPLALFIEAFVLPLFGNTPGKALFGISLTTIDGKKPSLLQSIKRCWGLLFWGLFLNIPFLNMIGLIMFHETAIHGKTTRWDMASNLQIHQANIGSLRGAIGVIIFLCLCIVPIGILKFGLN